ncbi:MAG: ABC transporter ATP-binding protein [Paracoccus sp. (in: a-proteobacteria)]
MDGLAISDVSFDYGAKPVLDRVSLAARPGRFTALLGPNGAGKSTLFALIGGLIATARGRVSVCGADIARNPRAALSRLGIVFQAPTLDLDLSVRQNLRYFGALHGMRGRGLDQRIDAALERLDMRERLNERARDLNGGHRRRMEIARALLHGPEVLVLDEPTVGLDPAARAAITRYVHDLAADGLAVLWATHLVDEIGDGDDLVLLHRGRVLAAGQAGDLRGAQPLNAWFLSLTRVPA